jgi:aryl-phospho-beta-D-glucosidase BglC (GH1 family)
VLRSVRIALLVSFAALALPALAVAATRMPIGFQDDPSFRWNGDTAAELDRVQAAGASIIRTTVDWRAVAPTKPASPTGSFDPAYQLNDLDDLVRNAQERGIQVMITIWGTPPWANGGKGPNVPPTRPADLTQFAHALADRYSGRHVGYPFVGRYSIWNEPNLGIFLKPQFDAKGNVISPRIYAGLYKAGYAGVKAGNSTALVAIGETSNQGRDHPIKGVNDSVAPGTFARLLAQQKGLRFDAYATHPYATNMNLPPTQKVKWPNVTLTQLKTFETSIDTWFHRTNIPVWITEYGYQTKPADPYGTTMARQASWLSLVLKTLRADPRVNMFIWFVFHDSAQTLWKSGLYTQAGAMKPAYKTFSALAVLTDGETQTIKPGVPPVVSLAVPRLAFVSPAGALVGVTYHVFDGAAEIAVGQPQVPLRIDGTVRFTAEFTPVAGKTYSIVMDANDINGNNVIRTYALVTSSKT